LYYSRGIGQTIIRMQNETVTKRLPRPSFGEVFFSVISTATKHMPRPYVYFYGLKMKPNDFFSPILQIENDRLPRPSKFFEVLNRGGEFTWRLTHL